MANSEMDELTQGMDANAWARLRQLQEQFEARKKAAAQEGHGDAVQLLDPHPAEKTPVPMPTTDDDQEALGNALHGGSMGILGLPAPGQAGPPPGSLLGPPARIRGASGNGRPYHVEIQRSVNPKSPTGHSVSVKQVYDDGR